MDHNSKMCEPSSRVVWSERRSNIIECTTKLRSHCVAICVDSNLETHFFSPLLCSSVVWDTSSPSKQPEPEPQQPSRVLLHHPPPAAGRGIWCAQLPASYCHGACGSPEAVWQRGYTASQLVQSALKKTKQCFSTGGSRPKSGLQSCFGWVAASRAIFAIHLFI